MWEPASRIGDFGNVFTGFAKSPRVPRSSWILSDCNLYCKIVKYCILSEDCIIKTRPRGTVSPQMWCTKSIYKTPQSCRHDFVKKLVKRKKFGLICFPGLIYCDQEPLWLLNVMEDDCYFLGVHLRLSTRCKIKFTLRWTLWKLFFSKIPYPFLQKSHECALKLTDLWNTSLLFDLNYKFELIWA